MKLRLFIAFRLPERVREELTRQQDWLKPRRERINWVAPEGMHLTLKFLGDTESVLAEDIARQLDRTCAAEAPLRMRLGEPGFFGPEHSPRVLWTGLEGERERLQRLARRIEHGLQQIGLPRSERRFKGHLTIGRVKQCRQDLAGEHLAAVPLPLEFALEELDLIESRLRREGPEYHVLSRHILESEQQEE